MGAAEVIEITGNATCIEQGASTAQENVILLNANGMIIGDALLPVPFAGNSSSEWQAKKPAGNHLFPDLWVEVLRELRQKIACAASIDTEHVMKKTIDGQSRWFHVAARSVQARDADAACHVLILRDITRQKRLEEENQVLLQQSEILKKIGRIDVLEMKGEAGDIELPESFREILQLAAEKSGLTMSEVIHLIHPDDKQGLFEHVRGCMDDNRAVDVEFRVEIPGEQARWIRCHSLPSREDAQGRLPRRWSVQDVTFYKKVNLDLLEKLKESNKHLLLANSSLSDFSYALSHDLKRPVRHMKSFAELLDEALDRGDVAAAREFSRRISTGASEMSGLIAAMHKFAQLGQHSMNREWVDHQRMVTDLIGTITPEAMAPRVDVQVATGMPAAYVDASLWRILWANLIENAIKYSRERPRIQLRFEFELGPEVVSYSIRDNGIGFEPRRVPELFQMFSRLSTDGRFDGTGIGLAYAKRVIEAHGGSIKGSAEPDKGATFTVSLPRSPH